MRVAAMEGLARMRDPSDQPRFQKAYTEEKKTPGRMAGAFGLVYDGQREMTEFAPLRYLINQLNSQAYRDVALAYLKELVRDPGHAAGRPIRRLNNTDQRREDRAGADSGRERRSRFDSLSGEALEGFGCRCR